MRSFRNLYLVAGLLVFLLGLVLLLFAKAPFPAPPAIIERQQIIQTVAQDPAPTLGSLSGPWFRTPIVAVAPSPKPAARPAQVDTTSVTLVGSSKDEDGLPSYFFKYAPSGQVIILKTGETKKSWTLKAVDDHAFTLIGPGGQYEVAR